MYSTATSATTGHLTGQTFFCVCTEKGAGEKTIGVHIFLGPLKEYWQSAKLMGGIKEGKLVIYAYGVCT